PGPPMDRGQHPSRTASCEGQFCALHAPVGASGLWSDVAALFPWRSMPGLGARRLFAAGTRHWRMDANPFRSSPLGARARLHGFRRGGAYKTTARDRGGGKRPNRLNACVFRSQRRPRQFRSPTREPALDLSKESCTAPGPRMIHVVVGEIVATGAGRADPPHGARYEAARRIAHHERQPPAAAVGANSAETLDVMKT